MPRKTYMTLACGLFSCECASVSCFQIQPGTPKKVEENIFNPLGHSRCSQLVLYASQPGAPKQVESWSFQVAMVWKSCTNDCRGET